jgi:hypothetical protein
MVSYLSQFKEVGPSIERTFDIGPRRGTVSDRPRVNWDRRGLGKGSKNLALIDSRCGLSLPESGCIRFPRGFLPSFDGRPSLLMFTAGSASALIADWRCDQCRTALPEGPCNQ